MEVKEKDTKGKVTEQLKTDVLDLGEFQQIKNNIYFELVDFEKNREILGNIPHKRIGNQAKIYYVKNNEFGNLLIINECLSLWGIDREELFKAVDDSEE